MLAHFSRTSSNCIFSRIFSYSQTANAILKGCNQAQRNIHWAQYRIFRVHQTGRHGTVKKIVQQVRLTTTSAVNVGTLSPEIPLKAQKIIGKWLLGCAGMCFGAVVLGGITRLTESGLSMVDWRLLKDMKPPQNEQEWEEEFKRYQQFPEYKYMSSHKEITLSDFKFIYYMEYGHRMWGRAVGLVFLLPALYFLKKGWISKAMKPRLAIYTAFIGFQGFMGWYMVKSGLQEQTQSTNIPRVSQYRLAVHLGSAFFLYALFLWGGLCHLLTPLKVPLRNIFREFPQVPDTKQITLLRRFCHPMMTMVVVTAFSGAFVAGLDAGLTYNSWPKMANKWIPDDLLAYSPTWTNFFENPTTVQFIHRHLAESTVLMIAGFWWLARKAPLPPRTRLAVNSLLGMAFLQATLGITTLLSHVPTHLAATHQSGSLVLLSLAVWVAHELRRLPK